MLPKPPDGYLPKEEAESKLRGYLDARKYDAPVMPKRVQPAQADDFVRKTLDGDQFGRLYIQRCGELMRFYDLRDRPQQLTRWLDRRETRTDQFALPIAIVAILGDLGDDALQQKANEYYQHLVSHKLAEESFPALVDLFFHLPPSADAKWIDGPLAAKMKALEPKIEADHASAVQYYSIKDLRQARLVAVQAGRKRKQDCLAHQTVARRRQEFARCYLGFDVKPYVDLEKWGMMMLQRECSSCSPSEVADAFLHQLELLMLKAKQPGLASADLEDLKKQTTRCVRAVQFYDGKLKAEQTEFAAKFNNPAQGDVLYWGPPKEEG